MKVIVAGSRSITDYEFVKNAIEDSGLHHQITEIVSGGALGVDQLGEHYATEKGLVVTRFLPLYDVHGERAPFLRNIKMAEYADALVAIWNGFSRGTQHMIAQAERRGLKVFIVRKLL